MRKIVLTLALLAATGPAAAADDVSTQLKRQTQALYDALVPGDAKVWDAYLDDRVLATDESGVFTRKKDTVAQVTPVPAGISGSIVVTDWQMEKRGSVAVAAYIVDEHENFHGQHLHAQYRSTITWLQEAAGWKVIAMQSIALQQDPPAVQLPQATLNDYVGRYRAGPGFIYEIARRGGELVGGVVGAKPAPVMFELRDLAFAAGQPRVRKIFTRDVHGRVTGFLSRREGRDVVWTKIA